MPIDRRICTLQLPSASASTYQCGCTTTGFGHPQVVVAANLLGTINAPLQTLIVADTFREGLDIAGIVLNSPQRVADDPSTESNTDELARRCIPPLLAEVKHGGGLDTEVDWWALAGRL